MRNRVARRWSDATFQLYGPAVEPTTILRVRLAGVIARAVQLGPRTDLAVEECWRAIAALHRYELDAGVRWKGVAARDAIRIALYEVESVEMRARQGRAS